MEITSPEARDGLKANPIEKLHPVEFTDEDGARRQPFTFENRKGNKIKAVFYTREELPFAQEVVRGNWAVVLGEPPKHRDRSEWEGFVKDVKNTSENKNPLNSDGFGLREAIAVDKALFLVENTPVHILDLAFYLGLEGKGWRQARQKAALDGIYTAEAISFIDDMIAGTTVGEDGKLRQRQNQEGEALAVLALLGDPEARKVLDARKRVLEELDAKREEGYKEFRRSKFEKLAGEGIEVPKGEVRATHVTAYRPRITEKGILIRSSFDGTQGAVTRNTIHFALGGEISSAYGGGGWEDMPYVVTGDLSETREANGNPLMINPVDTYFLVNPGQPLLVPGGHLTIPGWLPSGTIREIGDNITIYKNKGFTPEDIDRLFSDYYDKKPYYAKEEARGRFKAWLGSWLRNLTGRVFDENGEEKAKDIKIYEFAKSLDAEEIFSNLRTVGIEAAAHKLLGDNRLFNQNDVKRIIEKVERWLATKTRNAGFSEEVAGYYDNREIEMLAASWGTQGSSRSQAHSEDIHGGFGLTNYAGKVFDQVRRTKRELAEWDRKMRENPRALIELRQPWVSVDYGALAPRINVEDRKSIMEYFRSHRFDLSIEDKIIKSENRRMFFVAGVI